MKKIYLFTGILLVGVLVGTCGILIRRNRAMTAQLNILYPALTSASLRDVQLDYLENCFVLSLKNKVSLSDLIADPSDPPVRALLETKQNPTLVYYYDQSQCQDCILFGMSKLKLFTEKTGIEPLLLTYYTDARSLQSMNQLMDVSFTSCNLPHRANSKINNNPFFFVLDDEDVNAVFIPEKGLPKITDRYLETIAGVYWP